MKIESTVSKPNISIQRIKNQSFTSGNPIVDKTYGESWLYVQMMDKQKKESSVYPQDVKYRENLLKNAGLHPENQHKIRSIVGPAEAYSIMKQYNSKPEVYSPGIKDENVNNHIMRANLHMHTKASDGSLTVRELLDDAREYADSVAKDFSINHSETPFVVGITDHDTTESASEAIKIISEEPLKYKNLRVMLGAEITTFNNIATDMVSSPTNVHVLTLAIDPNEKYYKSFIDTTKQKKLNLEHSMVQTANEVYKNRYGQSDFFSLNQAKLQYNPLDKNIIGIYNNLDEYFKNKFAIEHIVLKDEDMKKSLAKQGMTDTDSVLEKMREFHKALDGNNKVLPPEKTIPEFVSIIGGVDKEVVEQKLSAGLKQEKINGFYSDLKENLSQYKVTQTPKYNYMPTFKTVYEGLKGQDNALIGIAHPVDTTKVFTEEDKKINFLEQLYDKFKSECKEKAKFSEVYYQSYKPGRKEFNWSDLTQKFFDGLSKTHGLLKTGSLDTHGKCIFRR